MQGHFALPALSTSLSCLAVETPKDISLSSVPNYNLLVLGEIPMKEAVVTKVDPEYGPQLNVFTGDFAAPASSVTTYHEDGHQVAIMNLFVVDSPIK